MDTSHIEKLCDDPVNVISDFVARWTNINLEMVNATSERYKALHGFWDAMSQYMEAFSSPHRQAVDSFSAEEKSKKTCLPSYGDIKDYTDLFLFNVGVAQQGFLSSLPQMTDYHIRSVTDAMAAMINTVSGADGETIAEFSKRQSAAIEAVSSEYPKAIANIKKEFGFHVQEPGYKLAAETDRFHLYQVLPSDQAVSVKKNGKPVLIVPPYVLGANILCFLPGDNKSYVHAFANQGIPTYIRIVKDIADTPAVLDMTGEDDATDTRYFCEKIKEIHGKPVTLNGYCQGGFFAMVAVLSGELDGLVDALITCVAPMDGSRSKALVDYMDQIPDQFKGLGYSLKTLPDGKQVVDGKIMSWVYRLKSMEKEAPILSFYRDLQMFEKLNAMGAGVSKTALAINHWINYDRVDLPVGTTQLSFDSYTAPVKPDGTLPFRLFGRELNFKRITSKGLKMLICIAENDDLVDRDAAVAPMDFIDAELTVFPKGHGAIATSWSHPDSDCALHKTFGDNYRGPVRYQLDLDAAMDKAASRKIAAKTAPKPAPKASMAHKAAAKTAPKSAPKASPAHKAAAKTAPKSAPKASPAHKAADKIAPKPLPKASVARKAAAKTAPKPGPKASPAHKAADKIAPKPLPKASVARKAVPKSTPKPAKKS
ncbi:MAG: metal transporter [Deltaproteobacteria bacterium]|nr:metal transporter [Deltaproteobacteria bacterium]